jgi:hypothetical protein
MEEKLESWIILVFLYVFRLLEVFVDPVAEHISVGFLWEVETQGIGNLPEVTRIALRVDGSSEYLRVCGCGRRYRSSHVV